MVEKDDDEDAIFELSEDSLEMLFEAMEIVRNSIIPPRLQDRADILMKAFTRYMTED